MDFVADIHLHSRWSRATSRDLTPENLHRWAALKGISVVGTADFTHPQWLAELKDKLIPAEDGLFQLWPDRIDHVEEELPPSCRHEVRFLLTVEISSIYKRDGRTRKVHNVVALPGFDAVDRLNRRLAAIGNLNADGRPILGLDSRDLLEICLDVCPEVLFIPAHIWTPHFAALGAGSGFDSLEACYDDLLPHIFAVETGLSSDPPMNGRLSALDRFALVSNSDAHSPGKLGREATCFAGDMSYPAIVDALRTRDPERFKGTLEFYPEEGKYHYDGHRKCGVCWTPAQTQAADNRCPECGRKLTVGVLHRVDHLADRDEDEAQPVRRGFEYLIPLDEVISSCVGVGPKSKRVQGVYLDLLQQLGPELSILRHVPPERIAECGQDVVAEGVRRMRAGQVHIEPGYDGEYGVVRVFTDDERRQLERGDLLFDLTPHTVAVTEPSPAVASADEEDADSPEAGSLEAAAAVQRLAAEAGAEGIEPLLAAGRRLGPGALVEGLDDEQAAAVRAVGGPVAVVAGPGSGKTRTLTHRIAWLIEAERAAPAEIAAVTFTQRAAGQLRERLQGLLGPRVAEITVGTFHRLALELTAALTGAPPPAVVDEIEARGLLADVLAPMPGRTPGARAMQQRISRWKAAGRRPLDVAVDPLSTVYAAYEERLRACAVRDYDDLLLDLAEALRADEALAARARSRFGHLLVDEFQDVNAVQVELVRALAAVDGDGLFVIGDPDQAIYGFRGADARCFDDLARAYPQLQRVQLRRNYRSVPDLVAAGEMVMQPPDQTGAASLRQPAVAVRAAVADTGPVLRVLEAPSERAEGIAVVRAIQSLVGGADMQATDAASGAAVSGSYGFGDIGVLFRTGQQAEELETCLRTEGLPHRVVGARGFLEERGARDAVAFFRYALEPERPLRLVEALRTGPFDIGAPALAQLAASASSTHSLATAVRRLPTTVAAQVEGLRRAAEGFARRCAVDGPAEVLRVWRADLDVEATPALERLVAVAETHATMRELLDTLLLGREADVERRGRLEDGRTRPRGGEAVTLMTAHAAKGLEFPVVILCGAEDGLLPLRSAGGGDADDGDDDAEERRLFYVALTRARDQVLITHARRRQVHGKTEVRQPSPFLVDLTDLAAVEGAAAPVRRRGRQLPLFAEPATDGSSPR